MPPDSLECVLIRWKFHLICSFFIQFYHVNSDEGEIYFGFVWGKWIAHPTHHSIQYFFLFI